MVSPFLELVPSRTEDDRRSEASPPDARPLACVETLCGGVKMVIDASLYFLAIDPQTLNRWLFASSPDELVPLVADLHEFYSNPPEELEEQVNDIMHDVEMRIGELAATDGRSEVQLKIGVALDTVRMWASIHRPAQCFEGFTVPEGTVIQ